MPKTDIRRLLRRFDRARDPADDRRCGRAATLGDPGSASAPTGSWCSTGAAMSAGCGACRANSGTSRNCRHWSQFSSCAPTAPSPTSCCRSCIRRSSFFCQTRWRSWLARACWASRTVRKPSTVSRPRNTRSTKPFPEGRLSGLLWLSRDGIPMRCDGSFARKNGKVSTVHWELRHVRIGPQDAALFEVPAGYSKLPPEAAATLLGLRLARHPGK